MNEVPIESTKERRHNGHPPIGPESYCRSGATIDSTPESRMSLANNADERGDKNETILAPADLDLLFRKSGMPRCRL